MTVAVDEISFKSILRFSGHTDTQEEKKHKHEHSQNNTEATTES